MSSQNFTTVAISHEDRIIINELKTKHMKKTGAIVTDKAIMNILIISYLKNI